MNFSEYSPENVRRDFTLRRNSLQSMSMGYLGYRVDWTLHHGDQSAPWCSKKSTMSSHDGHFGMGAVWHLLVKLLIDELVVEQRVEYLNRCWLLSNSQNEPKSLSATLKRLFALMR